MTLPAATQFAAGLGALTLPFAGVMAVHAQNEATAGNSADKTGSVKWTCPMHPHYIADSFGACPICGMDLVKLESGGNDLDATAAPKRAAITISPEVIQNIGIRLGKVEKSRFGRQVRSYGIIYENERLLTEITARIEGWIESLAVTAAGDQVKRGTLLFKLYSPQLVISQNDYLGGRRGQGTEDAGIAQLRGFGVQQQAIELIARERRPLQNVPFFAERDGTVSELNVRQGSYVRRGMTIAKIQDYSTVWLRAGVAEKDLGFISRDTPASVKFPNLPGRQANAKVDYIYPTIDGRTRTGQVRLVIDNSDGTIRPGSYADVSFEVHASHRLAVPSEAILANGQGRFVIVSLGQGRFEPRKVETGLTSNAWTEVLKGLSAGEDIVVSGQFLIDSESALRESFRKLERMQLPLSLLKLDRNEQAMMDHLIDAALYMHEALVDGFDTDPKFLEPAISIRQLLWEKYKDTRLSFVLNDATAALKEAQKSTSQSERQAALARLVQTLRQWVLVGAPDHYKSKKLMVYREEMEPSRLWLQRAGPVLNPYGRGKAIALEPAGNGDVAERRNGK
jgi:Cu(I)/Ag(I) efflux system membrane fusion protein